MICNSRYPQEKFAPIVILTMEEQTKPVKAADPGNEDGKASNAGTAQSVSQTSTKTYYPVESGRRLSSFFCGICNQFYREQGVNAWSNSLVPHFVSSNAYLAHCYARLIIAYATDVYKSDRLSAMMILQMNLLKKV